MHPKPDPFTLMVPPTWSTVRRAAAQTVRPLLSWALALPEYRRLHARSQSAPGATFCARALHVLDIGVDVAGGVTDVPRTGPLMIVANHPHGIVDGLALAEVVTRTRGDVRVLTNHWLAPIPELGDLCFFVDALEHRAAKYTRAGLRAATRWLRDGHVLVVFPSGVVAHEQCDSVSTPLDSAWRDTVGRLALTTGATVVPAFIGGRNRPGFYRAGRIHASLRTLLLARELLALRGRRIAVRLGAPATPARHGSGASGRSFTALLRAEVGRLGERRIHTATASRKNHVRQRDVADVVRSLGDDDRLLRSGRFEVYCTLASRMPEVMQEIGRLREITFRAVGEGTGRALDIDRFDEHYHQLFVWDAEADTIAGAYRIGEVEKIVAAHGLNGLYTSTLYRYDERLTKGLGPALELGRSFVRAEYQRSSSALSLLWKGIAQFVVRSERYRVLFGPVSISARYTDTSRQLLQAFLAQNARHRDLAELVTAVTPPRTPCLAVDGSTDVQALDRLIAGHEADGKGIPVLLRQYLRLNAKLLAFNIDHDFGDALDALMMVDLAGVDRAILARYFGGPHAARFLTTPPAESFAA